MIVSHSTRCYDSDQKKNTGEREEIQSDQYNMINQVIIREKC